MPTTDSVSNFTVIDGGAKSDAKSKHEPMPKDKFISERARVRLMRRRAKELIKTVDANYMALAEILYKVWDAVPGDTHGRPIYAIWGYRDFKSYVEKELGISLAKARALRRIWFMLHVELKDLDKKLKERIVSLGWTKAKELIRHITLKDAEDWVAIAEQCTYQELVRTLAAHNRAKELEFAKAEAEGRDVNYDDLRNAVGIPSEKESVRCEQFYLFPEQRVNVLCALERAGELSNSPKKGHQLDLICTEFLATNSFTKMSEEERIRYLVETAQRMGFRVAVIDPEVDQIIYGIDELRSVLNSRKEE